MQPEEHHTLKPDARWKHTVNWSASQQRCSLLSWLHCWLSAATAVVKHVLPSSALTRPRSDAAA